MGQNDSDMKASFAKVIAKSWNDPAFKERLMSDPKAVLAESGVSVPEGVDVNVYESTKQKWALVIPPAPASGELSDEALGGAAGGINVYCCCC
ncbi:MAG: NHLP leader peptide family RiPP precursor [Alphaproteobacteria bacterium]|jgi:hypothetical protein